MAADAAARDVVEKGYHMTCGNQSYRHLFYNLADCGHAETLITLLKNPEYPGWGFTLACGATTIWERWEHDMRNIMHSYNHPMFTAFDGFFYNHLAGIRMHEATDAFKNIVIAPVITDSLDYASAKLETVRGSIVCAWQKKDGAVALHIETPANTSLTVRTEGDILSVNGKQQKPCRSVSLTSGVFELVYVYEAMAKKQKKECAVI